MQNANLRYSAFIVKARRFCLGEFHKVLWFYRVSFSFNRHSEHDGELELTWHPRDGLRTTAAYLLTIKGFQPWPAQLERRTNVLFYQNPCFIVMGTQYLFKRPLHQYALIYPFKMLNALLKRLAHARSVTGQPKMTFVFYKYHTTILAN
jgi:hypothetical protein